MKMHFSILIILVALNDLSAQSLSSPRRPLKDLQLPLLKYDVPNKIRNFKVISPPAFQDTENSPESQFIRAHKIYKASEHLIESGESPKAVSLLIDTLSALNDISNNHPEFQPIVIQFRIRKTAEVLSSISKPSNSAEQGAAANP